MFLSVILRIDMIVALSPSQTSFCKKRMADFIAEFELTFIEDSQSIFNGLEAVLPQSTLSLNIWHSLQFREHPEIRSTQQSLHCEFCN